MQMEITGRGNHNTHKPDKVDFVLKGYKIKKDTIMVK